MSEEGDTFWISLVEKFSGFLVIVIGALFLYFTATSTAALGVFTAFFLFLSIVVLALGVFLVLVRPPE
jgi:predicted membrane channel-forming protein YqfA (hemolysin III family)